ncbi:MAG: phage terminase large subunit, partial [Acinetobacter sp.]
MIQVGFAAFYLVYAETLNWVVPDFHLDVCDFLEDYGSLGLLMMPRGHGKSTILDIYNAWKLYNNPNHLILHQGATDPDAYKVSRGTEQVFERHPLCQLFNIKKVRGETQKWWVAGSNDVRHGSIHARGILSNVTGSRANEIQNDDVEVPGNIGTPESREKLRYRLSEQTHILIPGGQKLFVGTPHTHDSLYEKIKKQRKVSKLILKMFEHEKRIEDSVKGQKVLLDFEPVHAFSGIGVGAKYLRKGENY